MSSKIVQRNSKIHGQGVFATAPIAAGEDVVEYKGKLRTHADVDEEYGGQTPATPSSSSSTTPT